MNKNIISLLVHDRYNNLEKWLHCWSKSNHYDFELVVIHNIDVEQPEYKLLCEKYNVKYIKRENIGFDTAPFQDICLERLQDFDNDWNLLMWVTDDWFPMDKNFIKRYVDHYKSGEVGVVCTEISNLVKTHIRTSGFLISKEVSKKLIFDKEQIITKDDCYAFEHRSNNAFYEQIIAMGLRAELVAPLHIAPIWDTGHRESLNRWNEFNNTFYNSKKVAVICPIYKYYPQIISSMMTQSHKDWELYLVHDGEADQFTRDYVNLINDDRIKFFETEKRINSYGHPIRAEYLNKLKTSDCDYVLITNADNYHTPNCLENLVNGFDDTVMATYCESMVHSYVGWGVMNCSMQFGSVDCASVMVRKDIACNVGWRDTVSHSSDWTYFQDIANVVGWDKFRKVNGCLLIHN